MIKILAAAAALLVGAHAAAEAPKVTLHGGVFEDSLMLVADKERGVLSGYYREGKCNVYFYGPLQPVALDQRSELAEAYMPTAFMPGSAKEPFSIEMYSRAQRGFFDQITLELPRDDRPGGCKSRVSLDRAGDVSSSFNAVRVMRLSKPALYQIQKVGSEWQLIRDWKTKAPRRLEGVWTMERMSEGNPPAGYQNINWYVNGGGTPRSAYIKDSDLFPAE